MTTRIRNAVLLFVFLSIYSLVAWVVYSTLSLPPRARGYVFGAALALALGTWSLVLAFLRRRGSRTRDSVPADRRIRERIETAEIALAQVSGTTRTGVADLPAVLVMGPSGAAKTSTVVASGVDLDLLAGEAPRLAGAEAPTPTETATIWFGEGTLFVEAGGRLMTDDVRWAELLKELRPGSLRSALAGADQAARAVVLCVGCDELLEADAVAIGEMASSLRDRLLEAGRAWGVRLPLYVLFSKLDQVSGFRPFVQNMSDDEAREILGVSLPLPALDRLPTSAETGERLSRELQALANSLRSRRSELMRREETPVLRGEAYDFPRELAKEGGLFYKVSDFLARVTEPRASESQVSPILRGCYFVGIRPVLVAGPAAAIRDSVDDGGAKRGATQLFRVGGAGAVSPATPTARRIGQWVFLPRLFREIVLADRVGQSLTAGGTSVNLIRRVALSAAILAGLLVCGGVLLSWASNSASSRSLRAALRDAQLIQETPLDGGDLRRLDALGRELVRIRDGHGWLTHGWGLNQKERLLGAARAAYFDRFSPTLLNPAFDVLQAGLEALPEDPQDASIYDDTYADLRTYQVVTRFPVEADDEVGDRLFLHYGAAFPLPEEGDQAGLASAQFALYQDELSRGTPWTLEARPLLVARTRRLLLQISDVAPFYTALLRRAADHGEPVFATSDAFVSRDTVPAQFTRSAWEHVEGELGDFDRLFQREEWVTGDFTLSDDELAILADSLENRYVADYEGTWLRFLEAGSVTRFPSLDAAPDRLVSLGSSTSPLLQFLDSVSFHTRIGDDRIEPLFQPVRDFVEESEDGPAPADDYSTQLVSLEQILVGVAALPVPDRSEASTQALPEVAELGVSMRRLVTSLEGTPQVLNPTERMVVTPVREAQRLLSGVGAAAVGGAGRSFCQTFNQLRQSYPFNPSGPDTDLDQLEAILHPASGELRSLPDGPLEGYLVERGGRWARGDATPRLSQSFIEFFNDAFELGEELYQNPDRPGFNLFIALYPDPGIEVTLDIGGGSPLTWTPTQAGQRQMRWDLRDGARAEIRGRVDGQSVTLVEAAPGPWALHRLFAQAVWTGANEATWTAQVGGREFRIIARVQGGQILDMDRIQAISCPSNNILE